MAAPKPPRFVDSVAEAVLQELKAKNERGELARGILTAEIKWLATRGIPESALWERWREMHPEPAPFDAAAWIG
jgi:hypothetical protein